MVILHFWGGGLKVEMIREMKNHKNMKAPEAVALMESSFLLSQKLSVISVQAFGEGRYKQWNNELVLKPLLRYTRCTKHFIRGAKNQKGSADRQQIIAII